jgi:hypothetical protein
MFSVLNSGRVDCRNVTRPVPLRYATKKAVLPPTARVALNTTGGPDSGMTRWGLLALSSSESSPEPMEGVQEPSLDSQLEIELPSLSAILARIFALNFAALSATA